MTRSSLSRAARKAGKNPNRGPKGKDRMVAKKVSPVDTSKNFDLTPEHIQEWMEQGADAYRTKLFEAIMSAAPHLNQDTLRALLIGYDFAIGTEMVNNLIQATQSADFITPEWVEEYTQFFAKSHEGMFNANFEHIESIADRLTALAEWDETPASDDKGERPVVSDDEKLTMAIYLLMNPDVQPALRLLWAKMIPSLKTDIVEDILERARGNSVTSVEVEAEPINEADLLPEEQPSKDNTAQGITLS